MGSNVKWIIYNEHILVVAKLNLNCLKWKSYVFKKAILIKLTSVQSNSILVFIFAKCQQNLKLNVKKKNVCVIII